MIDHEAVSNVKGLRVQNVFSEQNKIMPENRNRKIKLEGKKALCLEI